MLHTFMILHAHKEFLFIAIHSLMKRMKEEVLQTSFTEKPNSCSTLRRDSQ